jgi:hypoxanthine-DNA glycosylase
MLPATAPTKPEISRGFPPIADAHARVLILGSLPGRVSLERRQYYALPQNAFWKIMGALVGATPELSYPQRTKKLLENRIALWDVCAEAERSGSMDKDILRSTIVPNDFAAFLRTHTHICKICFNGSEAARLFRRLVLPTLPASQQALPIELLPSTSPSHAAMSFDEKLLRWRVILS